MTRTELRSVSVSPPDQQLGGEWAKKTIAELLDQLEHRKPIVYIAGPYASDPVANTREAIGVGMTLWCSGRVAVVIPHLSLLADLVFHMEHDDWLAFDRDLLAHADAVFRLPGESAGADAEVALAIEAGLPVFYRRDELLEWAEKR